MRTSGAVREHWERDARAAIEAARVALDELPSFALPLNPARDKAAVALAPLVISPSSQGVLGATIPNLRSLYQEHTKKPDPGVRRAVDDVVGSIAGFMQQQTDTSRSVSATGAQQVVDVARVPGAVTDFRARMMAQRDTVKAAVNKRLDEVFAELQAIEDARHPTGVSVTLCFATPQIVVKTTDGIGNAINNVATSVLNVPDPVDPFVNTQFVPVDELLKLY